MKQTGYDSVDSWISAICSTFVGLTFFGVARLSGILFVASMEEYNADRQAASFPYLLVDVMQALVCPVTGYFVSRFNVRSVLIFGSLLGAVGVGTNFWSTTIGTVTILWGIVFGLGYGICCTALPIVANQHFKKNRATVFGIVYVGSYVGISTMPVIVEFLLKTYGLRGSFLLLSGIVLHCVPMCMLLRKPTGTKLEDTSGNVSENSQQCINHECEKDKYVNGHFSAGESKSGRISCPRNREIYDVNGEIHTVNCEVHSENIGMYTVNSEMNTRKSEICIGGSKILTGNSEVHIGQSEIHNVNNELYAVNSELFIVKSEVHKENRDIHAGDSEIVDYDTAKKSEQLAISKECSLHAFDNPSFRVSDNSIQKQIDEYPRVAESSLTSVQEDARHVLTRKGESERDHHDTFPITSYIVRDNKVKSSEVTFCDTAGKALHFADKDSEKRQHQSRKLSLKERKHLAAFKVFFEPIFIIVLLTKACYFCCLVAFLSIVVDFGNDIGLMFTDSKYILLGFSIASGAGLLSFGWVIDCGYLSAENFAGILFFVKAITLATMPFSNGFVMFLSIVVIQSLFEAPLVFLTPLIIAEYFSEDVHEVAKSCSYLLGGPVSLATPFIIGYFRDGWGSYEYMFYSMSALSVVCGITLFMSPVLAKLRCVKDETILKKKSSK